MSWLSQVTWRFPLEYGPTLHEVAKSIAAHSEDALGLAYPRLITLHAATGLSKRALINARQRLVELEFIKPTKEGKGDVRSRYQLNLDLIRSWPTRHPDHGAPYDPRFVEVLPDGSRRRRFPTFEEAKSRESAGDALSRKCRRCTSQVQEVHLPGAGDAPPIESNLKVVDITHTGAGARTREEAGFPTNRSNHPKTVLTDREDIDAYAEFKQHCSEKNDPLTATRERAVMLELLSLRAATNLSFAQLLHEAVLAGYTFPFDPVAKRKAAASHQTIEANYPEYEDWTSPSPEAVQAQ